MGRSRFRLLGLSAITIVSILAVSVTGVLAEDGRKHPKVPAGSIVVKGNLQTKLVLSVADLAAMPNQQTVTVTFNTASGPRTHTYTGPLLLDVINRAGTRFDPLLKNDKLRHYVSATAGFDGYQALVAWGEFDPSFENKQILLAVTKNGAPLAAEGPELVVPGDKAGGRYVTGVSKVVFDKPGRRGGGHGGDDHDDDDDRDDRDDD